MSPKIVDKTEKRQQIAFAAMEVFGEKGFERTRMDDVAREAGVGKGTLYEYFKDKEALLQGAFDMLMTEMAEEMIPVRDPEKTSIEILREMTMGTVKAMVQVGNAYRFLLEYMLHTSRRDQDYREFSEFLINYRKWLVTLLTQGIKNREIRPDIDVEKTAAAFAAWFDGAIFHWIVLPDSVSLEEMAEQFLDMTMNGLKLEAQTEKG